MSININEYLTQLSSKLIIEPEKRLRIDASISHLTKNIWGHFQARLSEVTIFGSYDRDTIVPNDENSDVDALIVFKQKEVSPQTYLNQLKEFCAAYYSRSEIYQDFPTVVIDMDHMKFEIVPSYLTWDSTQKIPASGREFKWITTSPGEFKKSVETKDANNKKLIKPLIRIYKYWNVRNNKPFGSFELEKFIINKTYLCEDIRGYFISVAYSLSELASTDQQKKAVISLKERCRRLKVLEAEKMSEYIEQELQAFLPFP